MKFESNGAAIEFVSDIIVLLLFIYILVSGSTAFNGGDKLDTVYIFAKGTFCFAGLCYIRIGRVIQRMLGE